MTSRWNYRVEHNSQPVSRNHPLENLQVTICIRPTAKLTHNHLVQIRKRTNYSPRLKTFFLQHNRYISFLNWSQSQSTMLEHGRRLAFDFVNLPFSQNISQKNSLSVYLIFHCFIANSYITHHLGKLEIGHGQLVMGNWESGIGNNK